MKNQLAFTLVFWGAITLGLAGADYQSIVLSDSPVAYWRLDETAGPVVRDLVGSHDGMALDGVIFGRPGALANDADTACGFNANSSRVQVPFSTDLNPLRFSVECWARYTNIYAILSGALIASGSAVTGYELLVWMGTWEFDLRFPGYTSGRWRLNSSRIPVNEWAHLVGTFDGTNKNLYVNGVLADTFVDDHFAPNVSSPFYIGAVTNSAGTNFLSFPGDLDEVAFYGYALSPEQVALHFAFGKYNTNTPPLILQEGISQTVRVGSPVAIAPNISGSPELHYQWWKDGAAIAAATSSILTLTSAAYADNGMYWLVATNGLGSTNSQPIRLTVTPSPLFCNFTNGLVLHLSFDGNYLDSSGRANHGRAMGSPGFTNGAIGTGALHYNTDVAHGVYDYVTLGSPADLKFSSNVNFSVAYWVRFSGTPGDLPFLCNSTGSFGAPGFAFAPSYKLGGWSWSFCSSSPDNSSGSSIQVYGADHSINDGNWHHLVHSFDREGRGITYLDGVEVDSTSIVVGPTQSLDKPGPINIGQDATGRYRESGAIDLDDLGVWRRALTPYEAQSIYSVGRNYGESFDTYGPVQLLIQVATDGIEVIWQAGSLEMADEIIGPWQPVTNAVAPYCKVTVTEGKKFYRARL